MMLLLGTGFVCAASQGAGAPDPPEIQTSLEYQVKAVFLLNFARFVEWPESAFATRTTPFTICVLGSDPFGRALDETVADEKVHSRNVEVRRISKVFIPPCHVLYISRTVENIPMVLSSVPAGVLTVGEGDEFTRISGMIGFVIENRRVRFSIHQAAAMRAGLRISSRLLTLARPVGR